MLRTQYSLTAGVYTSIPALQFARRVEFNEDASVQAQGLAFKFLQDNYTAVYSFAPEEEPFVLHETVAEGRGQGAIQGWPVQTGLNARAADLYCKVTCLAGTTILNVTEID